MIGWPRVRTNLMHILDLFQFLLQFVSQLKRLPRTTLYALAQCFELGIVDDKLLLHHSIVFLPILVVVNVGLLHRLGQLFPLFRGNRCNLGNWFLRVFLSYSILLGLDVRNKGIHGWLRPNLQQFLPQHYLHVKIPIAFPIVFLPRHNFTIHFVVWQEFLILIFLLLPPFAWTRSRCQIKCIIMSAIELIGCFSQSFDTI